MALTLGILRSQVLLALGGAPSTATSDAAVDATTLAESANERVVSIINDAGRWLLSHAWGFRERTSADVAMTGGVSYVELPSNVGTVLAAHVENNLGTRLRIVTPDQMESMRQSTVTVTSAWPYAACFTRVAPSNGAAMPGVRLDLYPTPTDDATLSVRYRARWVTCAASDANATYIHVPDYIEALLKRCVWCFAEGWEEGEQDERIARLMVGPLWAAAWASDSDEHPVGGDSGVSLSADNEGFTASATLGDP